MTEATTVNIRELVEEGDPLGLADPLHHAAVEFLTEEAHVLDRRKFDRWLGMIDSDIAYTVPIRVTAVGSADHSDVSNMEHYDENYYSLKKRVERLSTEHAWAEEPPSRTRRFVTNVRSFATGNANEVAVESYLLLYRSRGDQFAHSLISGSRIDLIRGVDGGQPQLAQRLAFLDDSVLRIQNLAVFI